MGCMGGELEGTAAVELVEKMSNVRGFRFWLCRWVMGEILRVPRALGFGI